MGYNFECWMQENGAIGDVFGYKFLNGKSYSKGIDVIPYSVFFIFVDTKNDSMTKEKIAELIEKKFAVAYSPNVTKVTYKDGKIFYDFFQHFEDKKELRLQTKFRFVPNINAIAFITELNKTSKLNPEHSIILDCAEIEKIEFEKFDYGI